MRERWARRLAVLTCLLVLGLTAAFAAVRNLPVAAGAAAPLVVEGTAAEAADADAATLALGRQVYERNDCAGCHDGFDWNVLWPPPPPAVSVYGAG